MPRHSDALVLQPVGTLGNSGRNILIGPGMANLDFSLAKDTALGLLGEGGRLEFRADFFNIFNRVNLDNPNDTVFNSTSPVVLPTAGYINVTATPARIIQMALKIVF